MPIKISAFAPLWCQVLEIFQTSGKSIDLYKNQQKFFGRDFLNKDQLNAGKVSLKEEIHSLTGESISSSQLYQNCHLPVTSYLTGKSLDGNCKLGQQTINILQQYVELAKQRYELGNSLTLNGKVAERLEGAIKPPQLRSYFGTRWYLYTYEEYLYTEDRFKDTKRSGLLKGIGRAILIIDEQGKVDIENFKQAFDKPLNNSDYTGEVTIGEDNILVFELFTKITHERELTIKVHRNRGQVFPLAVGTYSNLDYENALICGTAILARIDPNEEQSISPKFFAAGTADFNNLEQSIQQFLKDRRHNFLRVESGMYDNSRLLSWLQKERRSKIVDPDRYQNYDYDVFISAPGSSLSIMSFSDMRKGLERVVTALKKNRHFERVYYAAETYASGNTMWDPQNVQDHKVLDKIYNSRYFILIYPESVVSSALLETGWALGGRRPCIVFHRNQKDLPRILHNPTQVRSLVSMKSYPYETFEDIVKRIETDQNLFDWL